MGTNIKLVLHDVCPLHNCSFYMCVFIKAQTIVFINTILFNIIKLNIYDLVQALFNVFSVILVEFMPNLLYVLVIECSWPNILRVFLRNTSPYRHPYLSFLKRKRFWEKDFLKDEPIEYKNWVILIKLLSLSFADKS